MSKFSAEAFSLAGDQFLGQAYSKMDCQTFIENMMREIGLDMDLKGSNAWYREVRNNGWVGTPEECKKKFGSIPKGALLFIHAFDGGEEARGYHDGLGDASHIGAKTGRTGADMVRRALEAGVVHPEAFDFGDGAIHSSSSRQHVATSKFADKTINGGWNMVGLYNRFSYGEKVDRILDGEGDQPDPGPDPEPQPEPGPDPIEEVVFGIVNPPEGSTVFLRNTPSTKERLWWRIPKGNVIEIDRTKTSGGEKWYHGTVEDTEGKMRTGFMMAKFVTLEEPSEEIPADPGDGSMDFPDAPDPEPQNGDEGTVTITLTVAEARTLLPLLDHLAEQMARQVGRG